jgi:hypothetical protein
MNDIAPTAVLQQNLLLAGCHTTSGDILSPCLGENSDDLNVVRRHRRAVALLDVRNGEGLGFQAKLFVTRPASKE